MQTFTGAFNGRNFVLSGDNEAIKSQLVSILNTSIGSRYYYPTYGSHLNEYKFSVLNYFTINIIAQTIKEAVSIMDGISLTNIEYYVEDNKLYFNVELSRNSNNIKVSLSVVDGVAS